MITENSINLFQAMLEKLYEKNAQNGLHQIIKDKAWQRLREIGLPTRHSEAFQYIRTRSLYSRSFEFSFYADIDPETLQPFILPECSQSVLVLINGHYQPDLSRLSALPKKLIVLPLQEAYRTYGSFLNNQWNKFLKEESDPFSLINGALYQDGLFLYAPPKTVLNVPIQILQITAAQEVPIFSTPRLQGFIGSQSQVDLISTHAYLSEQETLLNFSMDFSLDDDSHLRFIQMPFNQSKDSWHFDSFRANLKRNCVLKTVLATEGLSSQRYDYRISLAGENAEADLNGIWLLSENNEAHAHVLIDHQAPHCRSMQLFKGVLNDSSHSSFEGKILVQQAAQKTEAFQLNNNLLLSDKARAESKPNLEIFADDVKASHGATVGQLDKEQLFYLKTRGYSENAAKNLLVYGYCKEIFDLVPLTSIRNEIHNRAKKYLIKEI